MTDIAVAAIVTFGTIITALLGYLGVVATGARRHAKAARYEVQNTHPTNLRDDLDEKFEGLAGLVKTVIDRQAEQGKDIGGIRADVRHLAESDLEQAKTARVNSERIAALEQTRPPRPRSQKPKEQ